MKKTNHIVIKSATARIFFNLLFSVLLAAPALAQHELPAGPADSSAAPRRIRLILKDGSYQIVMTYRIVKDRVVFLSAERGGEEEEIPLPLVDLDATRQWQAEHTAAADPQQASRPTVLDPELLKDEQQRRAMTPEIAPDLRLPEQDSVLALDTFRGTPELIPLTQSDGDLSHTTSHNVLRSVVNPLASSHQIIQLRGETSAVQLHVNAPVLYLRLGDESGIRTGGTPLTVDTHGASGIPTDGPGGSEQSRYVIVRTDVRRDARLVASFNMSFRGAIRQQEDVIETTTELLPGDRWMKLTPQQPLSFGEYALIEILSPKEINLGVWDFGIHPTAPENRDALKPESKRPITLERRAPQ